MIAQRTGPLLRGAAWEREREGRPVSAAWDEPAWQALAAELDAQRAEGRTATFWWRDDDAGRPDPALDRLLALATRTALPLGLAVVPAWLAPEVAARLEASPTAVAVLQHGFAHVNHETTPPPGIRKIRPAECGGARPPDLALAEIRHGRERLGALGPRVLPVFVPPWNRIAPTVLQALPALGCRAVSAFGPRAAAEPVPGLARLNCHVDPIVWRESRRFVGASATLERLRAHLVARHEGCADPDEPIGLLTHHRDLDVDFWAFLEQLLDRLRAHPAVRFPPLPTLLDASA